MHSAFGKPPTRLEQITQLYNGEVILTFDPRTHRYSITDGGVEKRVPSVTTVCGIVDKSGPLLNWAVNNTLDICRGAIQPDTSYTSTYLEQVWDNAKRAHRDVKQAAADIGTQTHRWLESYFKESITPVPESDEVESCLKAALGWLQEHNVQAVAVERRIYSRKHGFSGTLDKIAVVDGDLALLDWKTSKAIYWEMWLQTAAYIAGYEEETGEKIAKTYLIRLGKEGGKPEPHVRGRAQYRKDFKRFLSALDLYRGKNEERIQSDSPDSNGALVHDRRLQLT